MYLRENLFVKSYGWTIKIHCLSGIMDATCCCCIHDKADGCKENEEQLRQGTLVAQGAKRTDGQYNLLRSLHF